MNLQERIEQIKLAMVSAAVEAFFPDATPDLSQFFRSVAPNYFRPEFVSDALKLSPEATHEWLDRVERFHGFATRMPQSFGGWISGLDPDILNAFPGQRLIRVIDSVQPLWKPDLRWRMWRGADAAMVALKTDPIWYAISEFCLPFPPFDLEGCWDVEDVDRGESERLELLKPDDNLAVDHFQFSTEVFTGLIKQAISSRNWRRESKDPTE